MKFGTVIGILLGVSFFVSIILVGVIPDVVLDRLNVRSSTILLSVIAICLSFSLMQVFLILVPDITRNKLLKFTYVNLASLWMILSNAPKISLNANTTGDNLTGSALGTIGIEGGWITAQLLIICGMYILIHIMFTGETENSDK